VFWRPERLVELVRLRPAIAMAGGRLRFEPWRWPGRKAVLQARDGLHVILRVAGAEHRLHICAPVPELGTLLTIELDTDAYAAHRAEAAIRFWRLVAEPPVSRAPPRAPPTGLDTRRLAAMLWALDLRRAGLSQQRIGREMGAAAGGDWADSADRSGVRRLLADADRLVNGGYLDLLRPSLRLPADPTV
jgi:hypothetical protein